MAIPGLDHPIVGQKKKLTIGTGDPQIMEIIHNVGNYYKLPGDAIVNYRGPAKVVKARHMVFYFARRLTTNTLKSIGEIFGMDHTSVLHGAQMIKNQLSVKYNNDYKTDVHNLELLL